MKMKLSIAILLALFGIQAKAQLTGVLTVPGTYTSIGAAIADLNLQGVGVGGVTVNIAAGTTETAPVGGYTLTATGIAGNPIVFQKSGIGANPLITAYAGGAGTPGTLVQDGVWRLIGSDYVTIDGIDITDPNVSNPNTMEFGYGLFKANAGDGCQFNTIKNCVITLNRINNATGTAPATDGSRGIDVVNALATAHTAVVTVTAATGSNSNNIFSLNTIQNCNIGIALIGFAATTPFTLADMNNDVNGNTIINYGGAAAATNPAAGVRTLAQYNINVSNNLINSNNGGGVNHPSTLRGIYLNTATSANASVLNNTVTVNGGGTTQQVVGIENASGATAASNTLNISGNNIINCGYTTVTSGAFYGIYNNGGTAANLIINNNVISGLTLNSVNSSGSLNFIYNLSTIGTALSISSNTIQNLTNLNTTGLIYNIYNSNATNNYTVQNNYVDNVSRSPGMATGTMYGFYNNGSPGAGTAYLLNNRFSNLSGGTGGTTFNGINHTTLASQTVIVTNNEILSISNGTNTTNGILFGYGPIGSVISGNTISSMIGGAGINGINLSGTAPSGLIVSNNLINGLTTTGAFSAIGITHGAGINTTIRKNRIHEITSNNATGTAYGINIGALGAGSSINVSNNYIGEIKAPSTSNPANAVVGINIPATSTNAQIHIYYNTIYLTATSSGANFGTSGIMHTTQTTSTTAQLFLRNNIIINNSTQNGTGIVAAYRRSTATLNNFNTLSNNNNFYVTAGPSTFLYYDGTNSLTTLTPYQTLVSPRDANSISENTPFLSTITLFTNYLHVDPNLPSLTESGAINIAPIVDDYDNDIRAGNPGYTGSGIAPDIGADEYEQVLAACGTVTNGGTIATTSYTRCAGQSVSMNVTGVITGSGITYQWQVSPTMAGTYTNVSGGSGATTPSYSTVALPAGNYYYQMVTTCTLSSNTATSNIVSVTVNPVPTASATSNSPLCSGQTLNLTGGTDVGTNFMWTGPTTFTVQNPSVVASSSLSGTYTLMVSTANCTATPVSVSVTITTTPSNLTVTPTSTAMCAGGSLIITAAGGDIDKTLAFGTQANQNTAVTTALAYPAPYTVWYGGQRMQMLILASELSAVGFVANSPIMNVQFPVVSKGANWGTTMTDCKNFQVSIGSTTLTNLTTFQTGLTNVVAPMSFTPMVGYSNTHNFSSAFIWDGTSNIILESTFSNSVAGTAGDMVVQYNSPTTFTSAIVYRADNVSAAATATAATPNFTYMVRPDFKLNGMGPGLYSWSPSSSLSSSTSATTVATPTTSTDYTLTVTNGACTSTAAVSVTISPLPSVTVAATPTAVCPGVSVSLTATGAATYSWSTGGTTSTITDTPSATTTYTVDGTNACGTDTKTISVMVYPSPTITAVISPTAICSGSSATLTAGGAITYSMNAISIPSVSVLTPTAMITFTLSGTDVNGCTASTFPGINVYPSPTVSAVSNPSVLCSGSSATLTASGANTYSWTGVGAGASVVVSPTTTTTYTVEGTDVNGCTNTISITQTVAICGGINALVSNSGVSIYPNPSNGLITLMITDASKAMYFEVYDAVGKKVVVKEITTNETQINLSELANGIYSYRLVNANGSVSQGKLIKN